MAVDWKVTKPLKLGFIGGGLNSAIGSAHFHSAMLDNRFQIVSGCFSRNESINLATCRRWNIDPSACTTDWREYLTRFCGDLDAIGILTPIPDHHEMLVAAMETGIPIICEKALVANAQQANELVAYHTRNPGYLATTLNYSGYPAVRLLRSIVSQGKLGTLQQFHLEMPLENYLRVPVNSAAPPKPQLWRQSDGKIPTLLLDLGVHLHHLLHFVSGQDVNSVMANFNHYSNMPRIVDDAKLWLECTNSLQASMWMSKTALGYRNGMRLRLFGTKGSAEWVQADPENVQFTDINGIRSQLDRGVEDETLSAERYNRFKAGHPAGYIEAFANLYWDIADSIIEYKQNGTTSNPNVFGLLHSRDGLAMLESTAESANSGTWVTVKSFEREIIKIDQHATNKTVQKVA